MTSENFFLLLFYFLCITVHTSWNGKEETRIPNKSKTLPVSVSLNIALLPRRCISCVVISLHLNLPAYGETEMCILIVWLSISQTRRNSLKLNKRHLASTRDAALFHSRIINLWNALPDYIVTARSVSCFKCYLLNYAYNVGNDFFYFSLLSALYGICYLLLTFCFFWGGGTGKWRFGSSLVSCYVFYLMSHYFVKVIIWQINWLIDWLINVMRYRYDMNMHMQWRGVAGASLQGSRRRTDQRDDTAERWRFIWQL